MRNVDRQCGGLAPEQRSDEADCSQRDEHAERDGGHRPQSDSPKGIHKRRQNERQHDRQRDGDEDVLSDVQGRDDDGSYGDRDERSELRRRRGGNAGRDSTARSVSSRVGPIIVVSRQLLLTAHRHKCLARAPPATESVLGQGRRLTEVD